ncbi:SapC family protein [Donghicola tyrosinivorans]|uniref:SapC protein n=1 Tax=Donghicola tyrosinivorans TaxID=1652492 RepID=A0A2T0WNN3_9RHOB|nr:SapC family protein [Donghicola tyrosinivorans]PRY88292.1 SapC protein [Donghicola tyrosinivorans]
MSDIAKMYESVSPINASTHGDVSIKPATNLEFSRGINSIPVVAAEFPSAAQDMAIVFTGDADAMVPVALTGVKPNENVYLNEDGKWTGRYVPAFLRRYPFIFARSDVDTMTLCLDEAYSGINRDGRGERLFDADGNRTQYLENMLGFVTQYQRQHIVTQAFCKRLASLGLLEAATLSATDADGETRRLVGFQVINRQKFKAIPDADLLAMFRSDELELCYLHMHSLQNLGIQLSNVQATAPAPKAEMEVPETVQ